MDRIYVVLEDHQKAEHTVNMLLLKRIPITHMGVVAREGTSLGKLPEAKLSVRSDIKHSLIVGVLIGGLLGVGAGLFLHAELRMALSGYMILTTLIGAVFGAWAASMVGMVADNSLLKPFEADITAGRFLLVVDLPSAQIEEIKTFLLAQDSKVKITCFS